jgi:hypothetical protein
VSESRLKKRALPLSELVAGVLAPVSGKRSYAMADLAAAWPEIVGPRYAECTYPERIDWPRGGEGGGAVLRVRADGPRAILLQHELDQLLERVNTYFGYAALGCIRLLQGPVPRRPVKHERPAQPVDEARLAEAVGEVGDGTLRDALARLGRGIFSSRN